MNKYKLKQYLNDYKAILENDAKSEENDIKEREQRINFYQSYTKEKIQKMTRDDLIKYIGKLWASVVYGNKAYLVDKMIDNNDGLGKLTHMISEFIYGKDPIQKRWDYFIKNANLFGPSYLSELLSYYYPNEYVIANKQVIKALELLDIKELPHQNYQWTGKKYIEICEYVKEINSEMINVGIKTENLLATDYFLWEIAKNFDKGNEITIVAPEQKEEQFTKNLHKEIIEKLVAIGTLLGFDAESEVTVAKGARLDAVWKVNIGNMGRVMYCFEVQSHGSIDSLILNLQKASNNKSVQRLIAVSDKKQLEKIKEESEPIPNLEIILWDYEDVIQVYESLDKAYTSINKLGLVPEEF